jgi:hypothetical protein
VGSNEDRDATTEHAVPHGLAVGVVPSRHEAEGRVPQEVEHGGHGEVALAVGDQLASAGPGVFAVLYHNVSARHT